MKKLGVILLSGGLDSTTVAAQAIQGGYELIAITLHYGQTHSKEIDAASAIAEKLGLIHKIIDVSFFKELAWYSALTSPDRFDVPPDRDVEEMAATIPVTYVPLRNTFFMTMAAAYLESEILHHIEGEGGLPSEVEASLFIAANAVDYSGYPDCRPEFYDSVRETLKLGSKIGTQYDIPFDVQTPLIALSKAEIAQLSIDIGAPTELTWSCYLGGDTPCGTCDSCVLRANGFADAGLEDPALPSQ